MSNLGSYQKMTVLAKKVGSPERLALLIGAIGSVITLAITAFVRCIIEKIVKVIRAKHQSSESASLLYCVNENTVDDQGLSFRAGDQFRVLESAGDSVMIELLGNDNNPYFVSDTFLRRISDYR